jgi:low temperature requirement protein LtrA
MHTVAEDAGHLPGRAVRTVDLLRPAGSEAKVTNVELFFDLVYVFAVTQLSQHLLADPTATGALQTALLLAMVWTVWVYTTWFTNWLDPHRLPVRALLLALTLASLVLSTALPGAFGGRGLVVGVTYAVMQIGRSLFAVLALRGQPLQRNFLRIAVWCGASGAAAVAGGLTSGHARVGLWIGAVGIDLLGGVTGFPVPGLGRSTTADWTIAGGHFAERCQAFILIALGESVIVIGETTTRLAHVDGARVVAFLVTFVGCAALWWLYFDRSAEDATRVIEASSDPGRLGRSAYHLIHPVMVAGIVVTAAADNRVLSPPSVHPSASTAWMILGGTALFVLGHGAFKAVVWRVVPWTRLGAVAALALLGLAAPRVSTLALAGCAVAVVVAVSATDRLVPESSAGTVRGRGPRPPSPPR